MTRRWTNLSALLGLALWLAMPSGAAAQQAATPDKLNLVVGEIADLSVASSGTTPVRVTSSKPGIVEVTSRNRLIGRSAGVAEIAVAQGSRSRTVEVGVAKAEFQSIAVDPPRVVLAVDETVFPRVVARVQGDPTGRRGGVGPGAAGLRQNAIAPLCRFRRPADGVAGDHANGQEFAADAGDALRRAGGQGPGGSGRRAAAAGTDPRRPAGPAPGTTGAAARLGPLQRLASGCRRRPALDLADRQSGQVGAGHRTAGR